MNSSAKLINKLFCLGWTLIFLGAWLKFGHEVACMLGGGLMFASGVLAVMVVNVRKPD